MKLACTVILVADKDAQAQAFFYQQWLFWIPFFNTALATERKQRGNQRGKIKNIFLIGRHILCLKFFWTSYVFVA